MTTINRATRGIFFVATGDTCRTEFRHAAARLLVSNPSVPVTVFTDSAEDVEDMAAALDGIERIESPAFSFIDKIHGFINAPYDLNIYMDTDTVTVGDITDLFALLERLDLAATHGVGAQGKRFHDGGWADVPDCFAEFNTGVVCFRRTEATRAAFIRWRDIYASNPRHPHDQPSFRRAMYESGLSLYVLPPEYNFLGGLAVLSGPVKVFHSPRYATDREAFERFRVQINQSDDVRLFVPPGKIFVVRRQTA